MANRPKGFGMTAELNRKKAEKFNAELATEACQWISAVLRDGGLNEEADMVPENVTSPSDILDPFKNGQILCKAMNVVKPGYVKKISTQNKPFLMMENIGKFLDACVKLGCQKSDLFQTTDLYDGVDPAQVVNGIFAFGRKANTIGYDGPRLGPEEAVENPREFSEDQLRASEGIIGLQAGSNKGASQSGQNFGKTRAIID